MLNDQIMSGLIATGLGLVVGVVLFVPFVAISYRRRGGLSLGRFVLWGAALVYFWAIWTYTLLPIPAAEYQCAGYNLDLSTIVDDVSGAIARGNPLRDFAILQLVLNVVLFLPLGFFIRVLGGRGVFVALLAGFGVSLLIETTQLTGVWGVFECAYRLFDVVDLLTNTAGAVTGSLLALLVPARLRDTRKATDAGEPRPVTRGRRLLAMLCDVLTLVLLQAVLGIGTQLVLEYLLLDHEAVVAGVIAGAVSTYGAVAVLLLCVWTTGRTPGDLAVELRYRGGPLPQWLARTLRLLAGIGGYALLGMLPGIWAALMWVFALLAIALVFVTRGGRGLPGLVSGQRLTDARARDDRAVAAPASESA